MEMTVTIALAVASVGSFLLLILSAFPGVLADLFRLTLITSCLWFPALGIGCFVYLLRSSRRKPSSESGSDDLFGVVQPRRSRVPWKAIAAAVLIVDLGLIACDVPKRIAFAFTRPAFERLLADLSPEDFRHVRVDLRLGLYHVDRIATDSQGGVYFRTRATRDSIDEFSYGFAYRPDPIRSPFGRCDYKRRHLSGDWYQFIANNDY
ncbi:hypothetical protein TA3x_000650 [Tundrisphaera sp. TA3]|uniref:hypothetical protein n=1 Tax=Tundrisphaera sp. TA3 TaxID=3435775 RepID=UPI003EBDD9A4